MKIGTKRLICAQLAGCAVLSVGAGVVSVRGDVHPPALEHKDYTLFMGVDLEVEKNHTFYPVIDVVGDSFVLKVGDERVLVPSKGGDLHLKVDEELKLTAQEVPVHQLTAERAYTPANDPQLLAERETESMADLADTQQALANQAAVASTNAGTVAAGGGGLSRAPVWFQNAESERYGTLANRAALATTSAQNSANNSSLTSGAFAGKMEDEIAKELFDAVRIEFKVSSEKRLGRPYIVVIAHYQDPTDRPGQVRNWIFAKQLDPIGPRERKERFLQGGLTPGFKLISTEFHLYNDGKEVATDVAHKRVPLTREEAFEYSMIVYAAAHKNDKTAPVPAIAQLPQDFLGHLSQDEVLGTFYVKVSPEGKALDVYKDESCTAKLDDAYLADALKSIWYEPALEKGKPVVGVAKIHPNRIHGILETKI